MCAPRDDPTDVARPPRAHRAPRAPAYRLRLKACHCMPPRGGPGAWRGARLRPDPPPPPWASRSLFPPSVGSATRRDEVRSKSTRARTLGPLARRAPPLDLLWTAFLSLRSAKTAEHNVNTATRAANTATRAIDAADERHSSTRRRNDTLSQLAADGGDVVQPVSPANFWFA